MTDVDNSPEAVAARRAMFAGFGWGASLVGEVVAPVSRQRVSRRRTDANDYARLHPESPIALAAMNCGAVRVPDTMRADIEHAVGTADLRRAYALGVLATHGADPDVHQAESGLWGEVTCEEYLARWIRTACKWQTDGGVGRGSWAAQVEPEPDDVELAPVAVSAEVPGAVLEYLLRLVHAPKIAYAGEVVAARMAGEPVPSCDAPWAADVVRKVARAWKVQR